MNELSKNPHTDENFKTFKNYSKNHKIIKKLFNKPQKIMEAPFKILKNRIN